MRPLPTFHSACYSVLLVCASVRLAQAVTIYTTFATDSAGEPIQAVATQTDTATGPAYTGLTAYNTTQLLPPPVPQGNAAPALAYGVQLSATPPQGLSIAQKGTFFGFSIELSVANQFLGRNSSRLNVPFLNYLGNLKVRSGSGPVVRVGGNSQERMRLFETPFPGYEIINKTTDAGPNNPTNTPEVDVTMDMLYAMKNMSDLLDVNWYLGLPFAYPVNVSGISSMTATFQKVLGDKLLALQLGNEPDLYYLGNRGRPYAYWIPDYEQDLNSIMPSIANNTDISQKQILLLPSVCCDVSQNWSIDNVLATGFIDTYNAYLAQIAVQFYPNDNCAGNFPPQAQDIFIQYMQHSSVQANYAYFAASANTAVAANKPMIMFETNTASCAGFSGLSDSFAAALWGVDWAMQLAHGNFSNVLFHFGGQNAAYNAFTPPPSNWSGGAQWSTGPIYYSALMVTEALGSSNTAQVLDMNINYNNPYCAGYMIYENGAPVRVLLINYVNDPTGASTQTATIQIGGANSVDGAPDTTPSSVTVRRLSAPNVQEKHNITWAGQNMGNYFQSDGRLTGQEVTETVNCVAGTGCQIQIPAPGAALVFLTSHSEEESFDSASTVTFSTTYFGDNKGPTVAAKVLATSNGRGGKNMAQYPLGSTSHGKYLNGAQQRLSSAFGITVFVLLATTLLMCFNIRPYFGR